MEFVPNFTRALNSWELLVVPVKKILDLLGDDKSTVPVNSAPSGCLLVLSTTVTGKGLNNLAAQCRAPDSLTDWKKAYVDTKKKEHSTACLQQRWNRILLQAFLPLYFSKADREKPSTF